MTQILKRVYLRLLLTDFRLLLTILRLFFVLFLH
jgi:hypothetical protein